ncbi:hypothetical protein, partial [Mycolicibacterium palauense]|uniref:hypothetical protein n=1 Tax=Mycolicibacterium palauense TaxID=2034511 RepID=UPI001C3F2211
GVGPGLWGSEMCIRDGPPPATPTWSRPAGSAAPAAEPAGRLHVGVAGGGEADGGSSVPLQRGHHVRCLSRTFHRVAHAEHTWITGPA